MQGGVHLLSGLLLASLSKNKEFKMGAVLGAILPDIDIVISAFVYLATKDTDLIARIHRTLTHSLLFMILVPLIIFSIGFIPFIRNKYNFDFAGFALGLFAGISMHILLDMLYLYGTYFLWPFSNQLIGFPIVPFESFNEFLPGDMFKLKLLQTTDFYTDIFFFYVPMIYLSYKLDLHKKIRLPFLIYAIVDFITITVFFGLMYNYSISYENHVIFLYIPGTFFLLFSVISPILFRNVIREFRMSVWEMTIIVGLLIFSQFLFYI